MTKREPKNLCYTCKHAEWFAYSRDGLCQAPEPTLPTLPHGMYYVTPPFIGKLILHRGSSQPQDCVAYEYKPEGT